MEILSTQFLSALIAIVVIDLVLAGDNAIVIALAARNLPQHLQKRAILWGTAGAIVVRTCMTLVVVWLLQLPGLLLAGGALLVWIAYRLLLPEEAEGDSQPVRATGTFWGAIRTVVVADTVMGLDNVLAVAGAAQGSFLLVTIGLLVSVPIVVWGSTLLLRVVERYPAFVYLGAAVLAWTAVKMMTAEPAVKDALAAYNLVVPLLYALTVCGVLWAGFVKNHRRLESRISARLADLARQSATAPAALPSTEGEPAMQTIKILLPIDGSANSRNAVRHVIREFIQYPAMEIHLLNVQAPFSRHIAQFASPKSRNAYHRDQAEAAVNPVRKMLDEFRIPYMVHVRVGSKAEIIADLAHRLRCDSIVLSTARRNSLTRMFEASVTNRLLELTTVRVEMIVGGDVSKLERYGIPVGIGGGLAALLVLAAD